MTMLPRASSPEELGISSQGVLDFIKQAEARGLAFHSLMLLRLGQVACELSWAPYDSRTPHTMFSLTKSFTSAAAGFAVKEGLLRYEDSVADILPDVVKIRGTIEIIAGYKKPPSMNYQKGMFKEFSIQFTRVYTHRDFQIAARLSAQEPLYERLVNYELSPEEAKKGFELMTTPTDAVKVMFRF